MASKTIVLISGGNAGIGYEIVKKISTEHPDTHHVLMGTRSLEKGNAALKTLNSPANVTPIQLDITEDSSIDAAVETISSTYGKLDILINNAATAGLDFADMRAQGWQNAKVPLRGLWTHIYSVNVISTILLLEKTTPLLEKSALPKVIFVSSSLGSISGLDTISAVVPVPWYNSSKASINYLTAYHAKTHPTWKVNAVCPGYNATALNDAELTADNHPRNGAIRVSELVDEGADGVTGTYSDKSGPISW